MTRRSLGETFSLLQKAARGAGMSWGMADECGRAGRWLLRRRLPLSPLAELLESRETVCAPDPDSSPLCGSAPGRPMCPVAAGVLLCDEAKALSGPVRAGETAWPLLLLPFLAEAAARRGDGRPSAAQAEWDGARIIAWPDGAAADSHSSPDAILAARTKSVLIRFADFVPPRPGTALPPAKPDEDDAAWNRLAALAARTLVPSDSVSRRSGAGAGLVDDD